MNISLLHEIKYLLNPVKGLNILLLLKYVICWEKTLRFFDIIIRTIRGNFYENTFPVHFV